MRVFFLLKPSIFKFKSLRLEDQDKQNRSKGLTGIVPETIDMISTITTTTTTTRTGIDEITGTIYQGIIKTGKLVYSSGKRHLLIHKKKGDVLFILQNYLFSRCICQQI